MQEIVKFLTEIGRQSIPFYWIPLLIWSIFAGIVVVILRFTTNLPARPRYHTDLALLTALPLGYLSYVILHYLLNSSYIPGSVMFIKIGSPAVVMTSATNNPQFLISTNTWIGLACIALAGGILYKLTLTVLNQLSLWKFHRGLSLYVPSQISELSQENCDLISSLKRPVHFALVADDSIPMTFGFYHTVIVIPDFLQAQPDKFNLAVRHELEHIRDHDYLRFRVLHLITDVFWFHPLVNFLEKDIILHREMDIDESVVSHDRSLSPQYAHLLLDLADQTGNRPLSPTGLAAHPSTIKKRITAMTHSHKSDQYRWLPLGLPFLTLLIALVMGCNNTTNESAQSAKTDTGTTIRSQMNGIDNSNPPLYILDGKEVDQAIVHKLDPKSIKSINVLKGQKATQKYGKKGENGAIEIKTKGISATSADHPDQMPKLIGGLQSVASRVVYPEQAKQAGIEGRVTVQFTVDENGNVVDPHVVKGIGHGCDEAALNTIKQAKFKPATKNGKPVNVKFSLPIVFKL